MDNNRRPVTASLVPEIWPGIYSLLLLILLHATRNVSFAYPKDVLHGWRIQNRKKREQTGWGHWISRGLKTIQSEIHPDSENEYK